MKAVFDIDLPRPRGAVQEIRFDHRFLELYQQIWEALREEVEQAYARTAAVPERQEAGGMSAEASVAGPAADAAPSIATDEETLAAAARARAQRTGSWCWPARSASLLLVAGAGRSRR